MTPRLQINSSERIVHGLLDADFDATHGIDHPSKTAEPDLRVVVNAQASGLFHGLLEELWAAQRIRSVNLVLPVTRHVDVRIAGDGHHRRFPHEGDMYQDDGICASAACVAAGRKLGLLILREAVT